MINKGEMRYEKQEKNAGTLKNCDVKLVAELKQQLPSSANHKSVKSFFLTISSQCRGKIEFVQFSNEVLFELLHHEPALFFKVLNEEDNIDKVEIYNMLENPIHDGVNIEVLISGVTHLDVNGEEKKMVLESLLIARDKSN